MMRRSLLAVLLLAAAPVAALPPANNELTIQPTAIYDWRCDYHVPITTLISKTVEVRAGTDATPDALISTPTISGTAALFRVTPAGKTSGTVYQVTVVVADAAGQRFVCDGKVTVKTTRVVI